MSSAVPPYSPPISSPAANDPRALAAAGLNALRAGDAREAQRLLSRIVTLGQADVSVFLGLAIACQRLDENGPAQGAVDYALRMEPSNLRALIMKGDLLVAAGDVRGAASFYMAAVRAAPSAGELPPDLAAEISRAQAACAQVSGALERFLMAKLAELGPDKLAQQARFSQSLEILFGRKEIYQQLPRYYFFPGLAPIPFFARDDFPWLGALEAATEDICGELQALLAGPAAFHPYVEADPRRPQTDQSGMANNPAWSAFYLWKNGELVAENAARCPKTMQALANVPLTTVPNRSPSVLFSLLKPGAHIPAHNGMVNTRLIGHLPLIVPPDCRFRVGCEMRSWEKGKAWLFDDSIEHEAWNGSAETRVLLLFEVWRPELTAEERSLVNAMFEAIDAHNGAKPNWEI